MSCFSTADLACRITSPYLPLAPHFAHLIMSDALGFLGISNLSLPHEHLMPTWVVVIAATSIAVSGNGIVAGVAEHVSVALRETVQSGLTPELSRAAKRCRLE